MHQVDVADGTKNGFNDPLRGLTANSVDDAVDVDVHDFQITGSLSSGEDPQLLAKEWTSFRRSLMQKVSVSKIACVSSMSDVILKSGMASEKSSSSLHLEELENLQKASQDGVKVITQQDYASRLRELKSEIGNTWKSGDRVTSLKLSIKVARLLMDTSVSEFYPTVFILVTDVMDMLGEMVWERIKRKAEYADDGTIICSLQENFCAGDVCPDAKETCYNWFCKIGSIRELLPRIYLELSILHCWQFLLEKPWGVIHRLMKMIRGLADPLASFYCRLYMISCVQKLVLQDTGYLLTCVDDIKNILGSIFLGKETMPKTSWENEKLLVKLLEPPVEWIMNCICKDANKKAHFEGIVSKLQLGVSPSMSSGSSKCISIVLHHFLKALPADTVCSHSSCIVQLIESTDDISMNQYLNYRLLGVKLSEQKPQVAAVGFVLSKVFQAVTHYSSLDEFVEVADAFLDIVLQCNMDNYLITILDCIWIRVCNYGIPESALSCLQSIFLKLIAHFSVLEDIFALNHLLEILHVMHGGTREFVNLHILTKATRSGDIRNPTTIRILFEISQHLHDRVDILNMKDDRHKEQEHLICRFVQMVNYGAALEHHLTFLAECRGAFGRINELKEVIVHSCNSLAIKAIKGANKHRNFLKSCIAFNEVTIPSVSSGSKRMTLYLETVEVALGCGLLSHTDGLIDSVICCLKSLEESEELLVQNDLNGVISLIRKLCSVLVVIPGNPELGVTHCPGSLLSVVKSCSWMTPEQSLRIFFGIISLSATLSQKNLPYHACSREVVGNDLLYFRDSSYNQEFAAISSVVLVNVLDGVLEEPHPVTRGKLALEACNCILSSFKASREVSEVCMKLMEIAKSCLDANDNYMQSTLSFIDKHLSNPSGLEDVHDPVGAIL